PAGRPEKLIQKRPASSGHSLCTTVVGGPLPSRSMNDRATAVPLSEEGDPHPRPERRGTDDQRRGGEPGRRRPRQSAWVRYLGIAGRDLAIILATVAAIVFVVSHTHPIFANSPPV